MRITTYTVLALVFMYWVAWLTFFDRHKKINCLEEYNACTVWALNGMTSCRVKFFMCSKIIGK